MSPQQAAIVIGQATEIGIRNIKALAAKKPGQSTQPTGAPQPLSQNKGAGAGPKSEDRMGGNELLKKYGIY
jgi:hypothetical protein